MPGYGYRRDGKPKPPPVPYEEGMELSDNQLEKLRRRAYNSAIWYLTRSDRTRKEIEDRLKRKVELPPFVIQDTLDRLVEEDYLNDERYAENFVRNRTEGRLQGRNVVRMELMRRGVDRDIMDPLLEALDRDEELERARELVRAKLPSTRGLDTQKRIARLIGLLGRRGYPVGAAYSLIREELALEAEVGEDEEDDT